MNKKVLIAATLFTTMLMQAQEASSGDEVVKNKKGNEILPKAGDIALGFNAVPLINTAFNAIKVNQNAGTFQNIGGTNHSYVQNANNQIVGKYYLSAKAAIRGRIGINTLSGRITNRVQDSKALYDASFGTAEDIQTAQNLRVEDVYKFNKTNLLISAGYEMRRGYRRLQGYYGGEIAFGGGGNKEYFTYANDYSDLHVTHFTNPAAANFNTQTQHNPNQQGRQERVLHNNYRGNFRFGMRGFIGIEYFVFAKISVGAEFGWGWAMSTRTNKISTVEVYENGTSGLAKVFNDERSTDTNERQNGFSVDNNNGGNNGFSMNNLTGGGGNNNGNNGLTGGTGAITVLFHF